MKVQGRTENCLLEIRCKDPLWCKFHTDLIKNYCHAIVLRDYSEKKLFKKKTSHQIQLKLRFVDKIH